MRSKGFPGLLLPSGAAPSLPSSTVFLPAAVAVLISLFLNGCGGTGAGIGGEGDGSGSSDALIAAAQGEITVAAMDEELDSIVQYVLV